MACGLLLADLGSGLDQCDYHQQHFLEGHLGPLLLEPQSKSVIELFLSFDFWTFPSLCYPSLFSDLDLNFATSFLVANDLIENDWF